MMRSLHRWISIVAAVFLIVVAITGMLLAMDEISLRLSGRLPKALGGAAPDAPALVASLHQEDLPRLLANTYQGARRIAPDAKFNSVWLRVAGDLTEGIVTIGGPNPRQLTFNAVTGERLLPDSPSLPPTGYVERWDIHQIVKRIHRGDYFGFTGRWMDVACGIALLILASSAIVMYFDMMARRRKLGRSGWFWS